MKKKNFDITKNFAIINYRKNKIIYKKIELLVISL